MKRSENKTISRFRGPCYNDKACISQSQHIHLAARRAKQNGKSSRLAHTGPNKNPTMNNTRAVGSSNMFSEHEDDLCSITRLSGESPDGKFSLDSTRASGTMAQLSDVGNSTNVGTSVASSTLDPLSATIGVHGGSDSVISSDQQLSPQFRRALARVSPKHAGAQSFWEVMAAEDHKHVDFLCAQMVSADRHAGPDVLPSDLDEVDSCAALHVDPASQVECCRRIGCCCQKVG